MFILFSSFNISIFCVLIYLIKHNIHHSLCNVATTIENEIIAMTASQQSRHDVIDRHSIVEVYVTHTMFIIGARK